MHRNAIRPTLVAAAVISIGAFGLTACGSSSSSSSSSTSTPAAAAAAATTNTTAAIAGATVDTKLDEFKIAATPASVPAGKVTFTVTNTGKVKHQFTVISTKKSAATVLSKADPNDDIPGAKGEIASIAPGATKTLVIKDMKAGHYALVCALPGHYQAGMFADFTVS